MRFSTAILAAVAAVNADVYMHNPRGSNDRNCEKNVNRNNGNRLFDSQNNAKGGYACGRAVGGNDVVTKPMAFHAGSILPVEWTQQHGCGKDPNNPGDENVNCQIVIQYACEDTLDPAGAYKSNAGNLYSGSTGAPRDGIPNNANDAATDRIPQDANSAVVGNTNALRFGMHETLAFYETCNRRERNKGLFTADQNVNRNSAIGTRQNPNGGRRGLECPEERDYYPYWAPSPWRDVAALVAEPSQCVELNKAYAQPKGYCELPMNAAGTQVTNQGLAGAAAQAYNQRTWPNNEAACTAIGQTWKTTMFNPQATTAQNTKFAAEVTAATFKCEAAAFARSNQLGNSFSTSANQPGVNANGAAEPAPKSTANRFLWEIPDTPNDNCVVRLRYNMSSYEVDGKISAAETGAAKTLTAAQNGNASPIRQDPYVNIGNDQKDFLALNVNTNQYGRTFQDRSYVFSIKPKATALAPGAKLFNLNVRGKRGNIVQTYPSVEYDFVPNDLVVKEGDAVHFQWTGSDYNPARGCNDGTGGPPDGNANNNARADRMNLIEQRQAQANMPMAKIDTQYVASSMFANPSDATNLALLGQETLPTCANGNAQNCCKTQQQLNNINAGNARDNNAQNCAFLNQGGTTTQNKGGQTKYTPYFDGGVKTMGSLGQHHYYSTRNNNFSNRDSKGFIQVIPKVTRTPTAAPTTKPAVPPLAPVPADIPKIPSQSEIDAKIASTDRDNGDGMGKQPSAENDSLLDGIVQGCDRLPISLPGGSGASATVPMVVTGVLSAIALVFNL